MNMRETAWRVFATELNASTLEIRATEEKSPSYIVSPLGAKINRVLVAGVLTEKENVGTPDDPRWRARIQDVNGSFYLSIGMYQPEALAAMADIEVPCYVAAVGRVKAFTNTEQRTFINVRPEHIVPISESVRNEWVLETAKSTWKRLTNTKRALNAGDATVNDLIALGMSAFEAENICYALDNYPQMPDSAAYLKTIQSALRMLLPDKDVDFGFPEDMSDSPDETKATISTGVSINHVITIFIALFGGWIWQTLGIEILFIVSAVLGLCNSAYAATIKTGKKASV